MISPHFHHTIVVPQAKGAGGKPVLGPCPSCGGSCTARELHKPAPDCTVSAAIAERKKTAEGILPEWWIARLGGIRVWSW
jgi:hypothetical protein